MRIGVDCGHTIKGAGTGAVGIVNESIETRAIGKLIMKYLEELGHTVVDCTVDVSNNDINERVNKANKQELDLFISIHLNASDGDGHGVEVFTANGRYLVEADRVLKNIAKLGYANRGIKNGTIPRRLGVVNRTKAKAMLIECFFCDNKDDVNKYKPDNIARAIVEGVTNQEVKKGYENMNKDEVKRIVQEELNKSGKEPSEWAKDNWLKAMQMGITDGSNPQNFCTREQVVEMMFRFYDKLTK